MKLSYEELISGDPIYITNIGHLKSPKLKEIKPSGIGKWQYDFYLNILIWEKEDFIKFASIKSPKIAKSIEEKEQLNVFDSMTLIQQFRELLRSAMAFFIEENLVWNNNKYEFKVISKDSQQQIGSINRANYEEVKDIILQLNYINLGNTAKPVAFASEKAKKLWEMAQKHLKEDAAKKSPDKKMSMGNIISKLSSASNTYNLLNIYDLTVFQLYDQFFQYGYLRAMELNERAYSIHGGKNFDMQSWLKPILK